MTKSHLSPEKKRLYDNCAVYCQKHGNSPAHTVKHTKRVCCNALWLVSSLRLEVDGDVDISAVIVASLLHDVSRSQGYSGPGHGKMSFLIAREFIDGLGLSDESVKLIDKCMTNHSIDKSGYRSSVEEKIVYDSDKLDGFGLRGVRRIFSYYYLEKKKGFGKVFEKISKGMKLRRENLHFEISRVRSRKWF